MRRGRGQAPPTWGRFAQAAPCVFMEEVMAPDWPASVSFRGVCEAPDPIRPALPKEALTCCGMGLPARRLELVGGATLVWLPVGLGDRWPTGLDCATLWPVGLGDRCPTFDCATLV